jgi:outer membrane immunogenic protein
MRTLGIGSIVASVLVAAVSAQAADMPVKARAPVAPAFTWAGHYIGGHVGGAQSSTRFDSRTDVLFPGFFVGPPPIVVFPSRFGTLPAQTIRKTGVIGGLQMGANWQSGNYVYGFESDISGASLRGDGSTFSLVDPANQTLTGRYSTRIDWLSSFRGRLGVAWDRILFYGTGGVAVVQGRVDSTFTLTNANANILFPVPASGTTTGRDSFTRVGWTAGGGIEWAVNNAWSVAGEYRHSHFGRTHVVLANTDPSGVVLTTPVAVNTRLTLDQVTLRVNYKYGAR